MHIRQGLSLLALAAAALFAVVSPASAQGKKSNDVVKATAVAAKAADGKHVVTVTLDVDPKYYIYANPVGNADFEPNQTVVQVTGGKVERVAYPAGEVVKDKIVGDFRIYKGKVTIQATVDRGAAPLEVAVKLQACSKSACLLPGTVKLSVP
ncbi:MAG: protein-disulfide reductase DsbD N-terminal domain-containing protein [Gemmataceae bacterium]